MAQTPGALDVVVGSRARVLDRSRQHPHCAGHVQRIRGPRFTLVGTCPQGCCHNGVVVHEPVEWPDSARRARQQRALGRGQEVPPIREGADPDPHGLEGREFTRMLGAERGGEHSHNPVLVAPHRHVGAVLVGARSREQPTVVAVEHRIPTLGDLHAAMGRDLQAARAPGHHIEIRSGREAEGPSKTEQPSFSVLRPSPGLGQQAVEVLLDAHVLGPGSDVRQHANPLRDRLAGGLWLGTSRQLEARRHGRNDMCPLGAQHIGEQGSTQHLVAQQETVPAERRLRAVVAPGDGQASSVRKAQLRPGSLGTQRVVSDDRILHRTHTLTSVA